MILPPEAYREYLDPQYRDALDLHLKDMGTLTPVLELAGFPFSDDVLDVIDTRGAIRSGGYDGYFDPARRLAEVEADGVVAEIIHPGSQREGPAPFFEIMVDRYSPELRAAGARAFNRHMAEFCSHAPERLLGTALIETWPDMDAAVAELRRAREAGLRVIWTDQFVGLPDEAPGFWDRYWDPLWATCVELDVPVHIHIGFGIPQGSPQMFMREFLEMVKASDDPAAMQDAASDLFDSLFPSRRPLWQLMWGGAFDRFPELKVVFAEQHCDWVPVTLEHLDRRHAQAPASMQLRPSEYWQRNCMAACTATRPSDVAARHAVGVDKMMFATDYPHMEGTWPNTLPWLQVAFGQVPEDEVRAILGGNAIELYGLDRPLLESVAARVGPKVADVLGDHPVDSALVEHFHTRSGFNKPALYSFEADELEAAVDEDVELAAAAR
jgi:predicted TIM-barrel fold metal-dependent hydrolase